MPSLKAIRKRIGSVKNTQKITRAMKLVSAAKLRRAQDAIIAARPYVRSLERVVAELSEKAGRDSHPLLKEREGKKASILMLTSDRGQAGAFNANIIRRVQSFTASELSGYSDVSLRIVGRKGNDYFKRRDFDITSYDPAPTSLSALAFSHDMSNRVAEDFLDERTDRVYLIFNEFKSAMSQGVVVTQLLPIDPTRPKRPQRPAGEGDEAEEALGGDYLYEPSKEELLKHLMPLYIQIGIYNAALESIASEFGARMTAMENATRNAGEMIGKLTLQYNRARQAAITKELLEIISGAEALKG
jgi:F-type H+-transporting ATPase subunit gamma